MLCVFICFYSVIVQNLITSSMFMISYCDYGDIVVINSDRLKVLPASFRALPALAISARLFGKWMIAASNFCRLFLTTKLPIFWQASSR